MKASTKKNASSSLILKLSLIFLVFLVGYLSYSLKQLSDYQNQTTDQIGFHPPTEDPPQDTLSKNTEKIITFTHPTIQYSLDFPPDWNPKLFISPAGRSIQPYRDLILYSPDYDPNTVNNSSLAQQNNASILVRVADTPYVDIESKFKDNLAAQKIARNITWINVSDVPAIQYDYSFKGENATAVTIVKDGKWYFIKYQYDNEEVKRKYIETFQEVLNSLNLD